MDIIPKRLKNLINGLNDNVSASIGSTLEGVKPILERNEATFFPDYTDHGVAHVKSVLYSSELLISEEAWNVFTREDAAVLVLATLSHDLGMLIDIDGFRFLLDINQNKDNTLTLPKNDKSWGKLWQQYQLEARRFDGATLVNILGSQEPVSANDLDLKNISARGVKIIGEFLRRHHHRLAHEIIVLGLPSGNGRVELFKNASEPLREIAGIVARSHGLSLRESIEIIISKYDQTSLREYRFIHPPFLMALIRLADYLDLDIGRAPSSVMSAKSLRSPVSKREWWSHRAIVDCHSYGDDPECLKIIVDPSVIPNVETFCVIEDKVNAIQYELDSCWAVLGEIYGRIPPLNRLTLQTRRIRSDLRKSSKTDHLPFVPYRASLKTAHADLLKLLIKPLYGDKPGIGIRELIQNSMDSVRELDFLLSKTPSKNNIDREDLEGSVVVELEQDNEGDYWVTISDCGIGMTYEIIQKYYLTAGASFRQSEAWKTEFTDECGSSHVLRSGRFGIGVLAAFLIGDRIKVRTRHADETQEKGIEFEFGIDDTNIEMRWISKRVGTTVKVRTTKLKIDQFMKHRSYYEKPNWDWYCLKSPVLIRKDLKGNKIKQKIEIPGIDDSLPNDWHRINVPELQAVDWSYSSNYEDDYFVCNGIYITHSFYPCSSEFEKINDITAYRQKKERLSLINPKVSIFDPDGKLPLNLARDSLAAATDDLNSSIIDDMIKNFIVYCLIKGPQSTVFSESQPRIYFNPSYPGISKDFNYFFFCSSNGFGIADSWNISHFTSKPILIPCINNYNKIKIDKSISELIMDKYELIIPIQAQKKLHLHDNWQRELALTASNYNEYLEIFRGINVIGMRTLMPLKGYERFIKHQRQFVVKQNAIESKSSKWVIIAYGDCSNNDSTLPLLANELINGKELTESLTEFYISPEIKQPEPGRIAKTWEKILFKPIIPFDIELRRKIIQELDPSFIRHLEQWKS